MEKYKVIRQRAAAFVLSASMLASLVGCSGKEEQKGEINELAQEVVATTVENSEELCQKAKDMIIEDFLAEYGMDKEYFENLATKDQNKKVNISFDRFQVPTGTTKTGDEALKVIDDILNEVKKYKSDGITPEFINSYIKRYKNETEEKYRHYIVYDLFIDIYSCTCFDKDVNTRNLNNIYYFNNCGMFEDLSNQMIVAEKLCTFGKYNMLIDYGNSGFLITDHNNKLIARIDDEILVLDNYNIKLEEFNSLLSSLDMNVKDTKLSATDFSILLLEVNSKLSGKCEKELEIASEDVHILINNFSEDPDFASDSPKYSVLVKDVPNLFQDNCYVFSDVLNPHAFANVYAYGYIEYDETNVKYYNADTHQCWWFLDGGDDKLMPLNVFLKENGFEDLIKEKYTKEDLQNIAGYLNQQFQLSRTR